VNKPRIDVGVQIEQLKRKLAEYENPDGGIARAVPEWRRTLIAEIVNRHYDGTPAPPNDVDAAPRESRAQINLAQAMLLAEIGRAEDAIGYLLAAQRDLEALAGEHPADRRFRAALADCFDQQSDLYRTMDDAGRAAETAKQAVETRKLLVGEQPTAAGHAEVLASYYRSDPNRNLLFDGAAGLQANADLARHVIEAWPDDAAAVYEAACRLTMRTPVLTSPVGQESPAP
jgi:hypothetical protein